MSLVASFAIFLVSLLVGGFGIYVAASIVVDVKDYWEAVGTALLGAIAGGIAALLVGWIPLFGTFLTLLVWIGVINWRYPGGWIDALFIGFTAWIVTITVLIVLGALGLPIQDAVGVAGA